NAEVVRDAKDPTKALLYFQPDRDLAGKALGIAITYANGKTDSLRVTGERTDPKLPMPPQTAPTVGASPVTGRWLGQDGGSVPGPGAVHVALSGLSTKKMLEAAVLSDSVRGLWVFRTSARVKLEAMPGERPLVMRRGTDPSQADLFFAPYRDERGATL